MTFKPFICAGVLAIVVMNSGCSLLRPSSGVRGDTGVASVSKHKKGSASANGAAVAADSSIREMLSGEWLIVKVGDTVISQDDDMPYLTFEPSSGRFYSSNGCNILNGSYALSGSVITFGNVLSTMKYCADMGYDVLINNVVKDNVAVRAEAGQIGSETYLYMYDGNALVMTLRRHNMEFLNGRWQVLSIGGKDVEEEADVFFDIAELKVHGNTGCNFFNGDIYIDPSRSNAIDLSNMGVTRRACRNTRQETAMMVALEQTASAIKGENGEVTLFDHNGNPVMILRSLPIEAMGGR